MKLQHLLIVLLTLMCRGFLGGQEVALPQGSSGLSQQHPGDVGIASNPAVVFADGFESGFGVWNGNSYGGAIITADALNVHGGTKAMEMTMLSPAAPGGETSLGALKTLPDGYDTLFVRYYVKFERTADMTGHNHAFVALLARAAGVPIAKPGIPADGYNEYTVALEPTAQREDIKAVPGIWNIYIYHPEQRSIWGDNWFPDGYVLPFSYIPGNYGPGFVPRSNVAPDRDRWVCMELMVKANSPGARDGRIAFWMDGVLQADFVGLRLRDTTTLKSNVIQIAMSTVYSAYMAPTICWIDDVVVATSYIGPMSQAVLPTSDATYVTSATLGVPRNDYSGWVGMQINVGSDPLTVSQLGRMTAPGNAGSHIVKLVNASDGLDVPGGSVSVDMSGGTPGQFRYGTLSRPVTLSAGTTYWVLSQEAEGWDTWYDYDTALTTTAVATDNAVVWGTGPGRWYINPVANQSYASVDFKYTIADPATAYVTGMVVGAPRNDYQQADRGRLKHATRRERP